MNYTGNLNYRHLHWIVIGGTWNDIDKTMIDAIEINIVADDESSALDLARSIIKRDDYKTLRVAECFTPHDMDGMTKQIVDKLNELSEKEKS